MQRMLVTVAVIALVLASLGAGALAAHWPFWHRAWQWQVAAGGWPELPGPTQVLRPASVPLPLAVAADARLAARVGGATQLVMVGDVSGWAAYAGESIDAQAPVDGRGLIIALLAPLLGALQQHTGRPVLDDPVRDTLEEWRADARGDITPRQLLWEMSGLAAGTFRPLNPWSSRAQLHSGPDFNRAALDTPLAWPPGSHFEPSPANAQLLSLVAARVAGEGFAMALQQHLWSRIAGHPAIGMLDHPRGNLAAHCCLRAAPVDWLRLGLLLANDGRVGNERLLPEGYVNTLRLASPVHPAYGLGYHLGQTGASLLLVAVTEGRRLVVSPETGRAVLWMGEGVPPAWLDELLSPEIFGPPDNRIGR